MKFEINSLNFFKLINQVNRARNKNTLNQHLNNIYLELSDNLLTARATNLEITCEKTQPVKGLVNGKCLLNGEVITKISNSFGGTDTIVLCEVIDGVFHISYQKNKIHLKTSPFEDFPNLPKAGDLLTNINLKTFINLIKSVSFCAASTEIKPEISSVYLYSKNNELYSVATDSFRLAEKKTNFKIDEESDLNILISQKCINESLSILENLLESEEDMLNIYKNENTLTLETKSTIVAMRSINGNFPDYKQLFPKEMITKIKLNKDELKNILNLSTVFVNNYSYIDIEVDIENKVLKTKSKNDLIGSIEKEIVLKDDVVGENISASYNSNYFLEGLTHLEGNEIELLWTTANRPMFLRSINNNSLTYLLMPLNR